MVTCTFDVTVDLSGMSLCWALGSLLCLVTSRSRPYPHRERPPAGSAGDCWNQSWQAIFWKIPWCVFFPCNLTLGRDLLIGVSS